MLDPMGHSDLSVGEVVTAPEPVGVPPVEQFKRLQAARDAAFDPLGIFAPIVHAQVAWMLHPQELAERLSRFATEAAALQVHSLKRLAGVREPERVQPNADDLRFSDRIWNDAPQWSLLKQWYLFLTRHAQDGLFDTPGLSPKERRRAAFWWRKWLNAVAPTNFLLSNPVAMRMAVETRGESLARGAQNFMDDLGAGTVRMSSTEDFVVGRNLATTPGAVVFRNRLLELIHYAPQTGQVHQVPIVIVTPWINKFYVLDLQPKNSLVQYLVKQGFSVFITSWKNPTPEMAQVGFEDYLTDGVAEGVRVARELTGAPQVHAVGYCIGGTLLATYMAWLNRRHELAEEAPVAHWSLLASLVDFQSPGDIEVFIDEGSVRWLGSLMRWRGVLDGKEMATTFRLLRSNSLIWHYAVHGWLYGERVKPMDVLFWNMDTTRMPYRMHEFYLREMYLENRLVKKDALTIAGQPIDLERIRQPLYGVSAEDDHITPWRQTFRINNRFKARKRFVLSSSGHILGIVNPPVTPPRRSFRVGAAHRRQSADTWHAGAEQFDGSWWEDWVAWLKPQCGPLVEAPPDASEVYPALARAPGTYVLEH
jgi:polyhydroxyalkanoate synthase